MTSKNLVCTLAINQFELPVFLGWPQDERQAMQTVSLDIHIHFNTPPKACDSDQLDDTFCYSWLTDQIKEKVAQSTFRLIEHLAKTIHSIINELLPDTNMIAVNVTKKPAIDGLKGGMTFSCVSFKENETT